MNDDDRAHLASLLSTLAGEVQLLRAELDAHRAEERARQAAIAARLERLGVPALPAPIDEPVAGPGASGAAVVHGDGSFEEARGYDVQRPADFTPPEFAALAQQAADQVARLYPRHKWHAELSGLTDMEFLARLDIAGVGVVNAVPLEQRIVLDTASGLYMTRRMRSALRAPVAGDHVPGPA